MAGLMLPVVLIVVVPMVMAAEEEEEEKKGESRSAAAEEGERGAIAVKGLRDKASWAGTVGKW